MSCFAIGKQEYVKAAGAIAGIVEANNRGNRELFIFDYQRQKKMAGKDFYDCFVDLFNMNALNVYEYYSPRHPDDVLYTDSNDYMDLFAKYQNIGRQAARDDEKLKKVIYSLRDFFACAEYQTAENDTYHFKMMFILNNIMVALMEKLYPLNIECWGEFNLDL